MAEHHIALSETYKSQQLQQQQHARLNRRHPLASSPSSPSSHRTELELEHKKPSSEDEDRVGIIHRRLDVKSSIQRCIDLLQSEPDQYASRVGLDEEDVRDGEVVLPKVTVDGHLDTRVAYIREHFEFVSLFSFSLAF